MILIDFNQIFLSGLFAQIANPNFDSEVSPDLIRHMVLTSVRNYKLQFHQEFGDIIFAIDGSQKYWRKVIFPYYKAGRKKSRERIDIDWNLVFATFAQLKEDLKNYFPYKVMCINRVEADDIIAVIVKYSQNNLKQIGLFEEVEPILILSSDQDFIQLQKYENVKQWSPSQKKWLRTDDPLIYLKEKIIGGDAGDGIPNILSDSDTFVAPEKRQSPMTQQRLAKYRDGLFESFDKKIQINFKRNQKLIDFDYIPEYIQQRIIREFEKPKLNTDRSKLLKYFGRNNMRLLIEHIGDF